ncbi:hypothetical protein CA983_13725 [Streptomyces swartbergensis]|uniref:ANTAR domain-containing protein n=1 Tax=Streptomyces swartbergensis TaxID=487165 RepID=A0A243S5U8_9ACTN|nr:hypothetical protein CA983_13725 [Streptomyces swartbergensis]
MPPFYLTRRELRQRDLRGGPHFPHGKRVRQSEDDAFNMLRRVSQHHNLKLRDVAQRVRAQTWPDHQPRAAVALPRGGVCVHGG